MAPSTSSRRARKSLGLKRHDFDGSFAQTPVKKRRVKTTKISGIEIHEFHDEIEMDFYANLGEPNPRKTRPFNGFDEEHDQHLNKLKDYFDRNKEKFVTLDNRNSARGNSGRCNALLSKAVVQGQATKDRQPRGESAAPVITVEEGDIVSLASLSDVPPAEVININPVNAGPNGCLVENAPKPVEFITIDSDSDDDVVMTSDPSVPLPLPRGSSSSLPHHCPTCGKLRKGRQSNRSESDSQVHQSPNTDEVTIITDEEVVMEDVPVHRELQSANGTTEDAAQIEDASAVEQDLNEVPLIPTVNSVESTEVGNSHLLVDKAFTLVRQQSNPNPPSRQLNRAPKSVPKSILLRSQKTGKTIQFTVNEKKSRLLQPSALPHTIQKSPVPLTSSLQKADSREAAQFGGPAKFPTSRLSSKSLHQELSLPKNTEEDSKHVQVTGSPKVQIPHKAKPAVLGLKYPHRKPTYKDIRPVKNEPHERVPSVIKSVDKVTEDLPSKQKTAPSTLSTGTFRNVHQPARNSISKARPIGSPIVVPVAMANIEKFSPEKKYIMLPKSQLQSFQRFLGQMTVVKDNTPATVQQLVHSNESKASIVRPPLSNIASVPADIFDIIKTITSEPMVVEDATRSVVNDLVNFVCVQEQFPASLQYQYDAKRMEASCPAVPCGELRCRSGCVCISLSKRSVRRVRCNNVECIFGCCCKSHSVAPQASRHGKTVPNLRKFEGSSRRKQMHTVLQDCDMSSFEMSSGASTQTPIKGYMPVQKPLSVPKTHVFGCQSSQASPDSDRSGSGYGGMSTPVSNGLRVVQKVSGVQRFSSLLRAQGTRSAANGDVGVSGVHHGSVVAVASKPVVNGSLPAQTVPRRPVHGNGVQRSGMGSTPRLTPNGFQPAHPPRFNQQSDASRGLHDSGISTPPRSTPNRFPSAEANSTSVAQGRPNITVTTHPRRCFGREKIPIPDHALMCMTPGFGYVPLDETTPKVIIRDPFKDGQRKSFLHVRQATEYLNENLSSILITAPNLMWVVACKSTLEKKQLHRLCIDSLKNPNCSVSGTGAVFSS